MTSLVSSWVRLPVACLPSVYTPHMFTQYFTRFSATQKLATTACCALFLLAACSTPPIAETPLAQRPLASHAGQEVAMFALGLIDTGYRFGGKNPDAGLDCSGMVSYVFAQATGLRLAGSAADIARRGRPVAREQLQPGDLVFFNTRNAPFSHVGVYIGDQRFVHAPSSNGRVRIDRLSSRYYAERFETARNYFE